jgi:hypothetical protein
MTTRSILLAAMALATLLPIGSADAYPRWGHWPSQHWSTRVPTRNVGSLVIHNMLGNGRGVVR